MNKQPHEEIHRARSRGVLAQRLLPVLVESGLRQPPGMWMHSSSPAGKLSESYTQGILWRLHYMGKID